MIERIDIFVYTLSNRRPRYSNRYDMRLFVRSTDVYKAKQHWPKSCIVNARLIHAISRRAGYKATMTQWRSVKDDDVHGPVWWISAVVDMAIDSVTLHHSHLLYFSLITARLHQRCHRHRLTNTCTKKACPVAWRMTDGLLINCVISRQRSVIVIRTHENLQCVRSCY